MYNKPMLGEERTRECFLAQDNVVESSAFFYRVAPKITTLRMLQRDSFGRGSYQ